MKTEDVFFYVSLIRLIWLALILSMLVYVGIATNAFLRDLVERKVVTRVRYSRNDTLQVSKLACLFIV